MDPWCSQGGYLRGFGDSGGEGSFPDGGANTLESTQQWAVDSPLWTESSSCLAAAKPKTIQNNNQSEVTSVFTPPDTMLYNDGLRNSRTA
jgi:hypothetical protein